MAKQEITCDDILKELRAKQYRPVYYLMGEEPYYIDLIADYITDNILTETEKEFNLTVVYGADVDIATVINAAKRYPMMSEHQVVVVKEAQNIRNMEELSYYLQKPLLSTILVICHKHGVLDRRKKLAAEIEKTGVLFESKKVKDAQLPAFITSYMKRKGIDVDPKATAMLAGDVLLTEAFNAVAHAPASAEIRVRAAQALGMGAGSHGMVYGQELDLKYEALAATEEQLRLIHRHKTGALINAAIQMGAAAAQATEQQSKELEDYAYGIGLVFQIVDDVLDVVGSQEQLGKPIGSDSENGKTTFVTLFGTDGAMELAKKLNDETCASLHREFGEKSAFLVELARELLVRRS